MTAIAVPAKAGDVYVDILLDEEDVARLAGRKLSIGSHGYAQMWDGQVMLLHRWLMNVPAGTGYRVIVDHINHDILDCRRENLRIVTPTESNLNRRVAARDLPLGVYRDRGGKRYVAKIKRHRKSRNLGTFDTPDQAAEAVEAARRELDRGAFAAPPPAAA
ncbi:HNH endonuclease [Kitasatospora sp. NBC_01287]|uniref:HNH endonuclease n=1 Tax=Kitasatospora sp. NBC_01287 TaxID=2903573 RepID=UPI0022541F4C|nr:AP2 domain-containing protein [Kitasatospora sp. NBC_01287]MCX4751726.1 HNH endonuclease [Kitasatospora sp. NBC_01287]MCX4751982.1 HNH endonuclease [Kitasatospora sp. NBC_01287]